MTARILDFQGIDNFRDYGGYRTGRAVSIARGRLLRSAHHARASDSDLEKLAGLEISTIVDLRRANERREQPSRRWAGCAAEIIASDHGAEGDAPHIAFLKSEVLTPTSGRAFMTGTYRKMAYGPAHVELFGRYFRALAEAQGAVVIHCAAGKDRTGLLAALTHHLLGAHSDDLMEDYLLTNAAVNLDERAPGIARQIASMTGRTPDHDAVVAFLGVEPDYLHAAFDEIAVRSGSIEAYLHDVLGVDQALRERIEARLCA